MLNLPSNGADIELDLVLIGDTISDFTPFNGFIIVTLTKLALDAADVVGCVVVGFVSLLAVVVAATTPSVGNSVAVTAELVAVADFTSLLVSLNGFVSAASPLNALLLNFESALSLLDASSGSVLTAMAAVSFVLVLSASETFVAVASVSFVFIVVDTGKKMETRFRY